MHDDARLSLLLASIPTRNTVYDAQGVSTFYCDIQISRRDGKSCQCVQEVQGGCSVDIICRADQRSTLRLLMDYSNASDKYEGRSEIKKETKQYVVNDGICMKRGDR